MLKWIIILPLLIMELLLPATPVIADITDQVVTVYATPGASGGIIGFTITYISDTQLDLDWSLTGDAVSIMIRAKYGSYPSNIPDIFTTPSDGYLVYSGNATSASDTSMNFDENAGVLYYVAWAQKADGTWFMDIKTGSEESKVMTLLGILAFCGIISYLALRNNFFGLKLIAGMSWIAFFIYFKTSPPSAITEGSAAHTAILVIAIGVGLMIILAGLGRGIQRTEKWSDREETSNHFGLPNWMKNMTVDDLEQKKRNTDKEVAEYEDRMDRALGLGRYSRRR